MIVYPGPVDDPHEVVQFLRKEADKLRALALKVGLPAEYVASLQ